MILIVTALRCEAAPFINYYKLKRNLSHKHHEVFENQDHSVTLLITRPGKIPATIALTELLTGLSITQDDYMINIGICGFNGVSDTLPEIPVYLCHSITDHDTKRHFYPDILIKHPFYEAELETFSVSVRGDSASLSPAATLVDMEASALYEAGCYHFSSSQMFFIKIPSDNLNPEAVTKERATALMTDCAPLIFKWLDKLNKASYNSSASDALLLSSDELSLFNELSEGLKLSATMKEQLKHLFIYKKLKDGDLSLVKAFMLPSGNITNQKRKILFDELRKQFIQ